MTEPSESSKEATEPPFPRGKALPTQSPLFWAQQKDRYLRQLLIRDIEEQTGRCIVVYFANRFNGDAQIDHGDLAYMAELLGDIGGAPTDMLMETNGGMTDATVSIVSLLESSLPDFRVIVANAAKSNSTMLCLAANTIVMGPTSELGPIDPHLNGVPCSILAEPPVAAQNYPLHRLAQYSIKQSEKLATRLLKEGMLKGADDARIDEVVRSLNSKEMFHSHGSAIDHREAASLGLNIVVLDSDDELWRKLWLLHCIYAHDVSNANYLKIFEGSRRSTAVAAPTP